MFFFLFFPWKERTKGTSKKTTIAKRQKSRKSKKHRNELAHFCVFAFGTRHRRCRRIDYMIYNQSCIFCLANLGCTHYPKVFGVQGYFFKNTPHYFSPINANLNAKNCKSLKTSFCSFLCFFSYFALEELIKIAGDHTVIELTHLIRAAAEETLKAHM